MSAAKTDSEFRASLRELVDFFELVEANKRKPMNASDWLLVLDALRAGSRYAEIRCDQLDRAEIAERKRKAGGPS